MTGIIVYATKGSAEVIGIGWLLLEAKNCEEGYCMNESTGIHDEFSIVEPSQA